MGTARPMAPMSSFRRKTPRSTAIRCTEDAMTVNHDTRGRSHHEHTMMTDMTGPILPGTVEYGMRAMGRAMCGAGMALLMVGCIGEKASAPSLQAGAQTLRK